MPRTARRTAVSLLVVAVAAAAGLTGCRGGSGGVTASGTAAPDVPTTSTTVAPEPTSSTTRRSTTTGRAATTTTARGTGASTSSTAGGKPQVVAPQQGDKVVAVFVATGASLDEPAFTQAIARLKALGYPAYSGGDTGCSRGAKEALPQLGQYSLSVEFATRPEADRFATLYGKVIGIATVTVYCAD